MTKLIFNHVCQGDGRPAHAYNTNSKKQKLRIRPRAKLTTKRKNICFQIC